MNGLQVIPRASDGILQVAFNGRISTETQDIGNIEASFIPLQALLNKMWDGPVAIDRYGEQSSGLNIDRPEMKRLNKRIEAGKLDLILSEDLGRFYRDAEALWRLLNLCEKHHVRVICPGDDLDTANEHWKKTAHTAIANHCGFIDDTRRRLKRTGTKRFAEGGMWIHEPPGYRKLSLEEARARTDAPGLRGMLIESCRPIVEDARQKIVAEHYSYARLADHFNAIGFKPSSRVKCGLWNGDRVKTWLRNPILCGRRQRGVNLNGRDPVTKAKEVTRNAAPQEQYHGALAFMTEEQFLEMQRVLDGNANGQPKGEESGAVKRRRGVGVQVQAQRAPRPHVRQERPRHLSPDVHPNGARREPSRERPHHGPHRPVLRRHRANLGRPPGGPRRYVTLTPAGRQGANESFGSETLALGFLAGHGFQVQPDGRRLVFDANQQTVRRYNANGTRDNTFNRGSPFSGVAAIAFGPSNTLLTADTGRSDTDAPFVVRRIEL